VAVDLRSGVSREHADIVGEVILSAPRRSIEVHFANPNIEVESRAQRSIICTFVLIGIALRVESPQGENS
jgi:hypothetical protein